MNTGVCYLIHNKDEYPSNKKKLIKAIEKKNLDLDYIYDASVVEFREDLYLIIDGHTAFLGDDKFVKKLSKLICPAYKENAELLSALESLLEMYFLMNEVEEMKDSLNEELRKRYEEMKALMEETKFSLERFKRECLYFGVMFGENEELLCKLFGIEEEPDLLEQLSEDIFKATSEKVSVGEVQFVETLYQMDI